MNNKNYKNDNLLLEILTILFLAFNFNTAFGNIDTQSPKQTDSVAKIKVAENYGKLPLSFEVNRGQTDKSVRFLSRGASYGLFLTPTEAVIILHKPKPIENDLSQGKGQPLDPKKTQKTAKSTSSAAAATLRMKLVSANPNPTIEGLDSLPGKVNYLKGNDPAKWHKGVATYAKVRYQSVYEGIDLVYYGNQRQLEYDFIVAPGADPKSIQLDFDGAAKRIIDKQGNLVLMSANGDIYLRKPRIYQNINGQQQEIDSRYVLQKTKKSQTDMIGFHIEAYDKTKPLVIDPILVYSTYLGGNNSEGLSGPHSIAVDTHGNTYLTGSTASLDFPITSGAFDTIHNPYGSSNYSDAFVAKLNSEGTEIIYATYLGSGSQSGSGGVGIAVDNQEGAYVIGYTQAGDFPITSNAFDTTYGPNSRIEYHDGFVTKIDSTGSTLIYSSFLGGNRYDFLNSIALDRYGNAYVTGWTDSETFPVTPLTFDTTPPGYGQVDAFVVKVNAQGDSLAYSTFLGGMNTDLSNDIAVDSEGNAYVTGRTDSSDFPVTPDAFDTSLKGGFVTKLNATGTALIYSTFLGGSQGGNELSGIALDRSRNAYETVKEFEPPSMV